MSLPISGKDTKITLTVDGALKKVVDKITDFQCSDTLDEMVTKVIGESGSYVDHEFVGHEGSIEFAPDSKGPDEIQDEIQAARIVGAIVVVNVTETTHYRDLTTKTYVYPDVKIQWKRSARRGETQKMTYSWKSGVNRIAV